MRTELPIHTTKGNRPGACIAIARAQQGAGMVGVVRAAGAAGTAGTAGTTGTAWTAWRERWQRQLVRQGRHGEVVAGTTGMTGTA